MNERRVFYDGVKLDNLVKSRHPVEKRGPAFCNSMKTLDSGFRRNDEKRAFGTFYESIKDGLIKNLPDEYRFKC